MLPAVAALALILAALPACSRPRAHNETPDAGPGPAPRLPELLPPPSAWAFERVRVDAGIALPDGCRLRAPITRARVSDHTRFVAEPRGLATLIVADATDASSERLAGVAALTLDPEGASRDPARVPWFEPGALPRLGRSGSRWVAALERGASVVVWRGGEAEAIGEGDGFEAADLACGEARCALLATRPLTVAAPGATVWIGAPDEPAGRWQKVEILPRAVDGEMRPFSVASFDAAAGVAKVALIEKGDLTAHEVGPGGTKEVARVTAPHGALDAVAIPKLVAFGSATAVGDGGCARDGAPAVRFVREGAPPSDFPQPAPPAQGYLRPLAKGALAAWIGPVGCGMARKVVYAIVLDEGGAPVGAPIPVGDATGLAVAARGEEVDLWLQGAASVTWLRARCAAR